MPRKPGEIYKHEANPNRPLCRHCHRAYSVRPRGLCWSCYYKPGVRERYPPVTEFACRRQDDFHGGHELPDRPTEAAPGSDEKITVLAERVLARRRLHHPRDISMDPEIATFLNGLYA